MTKLYGVTCTAMKADGPFTSHQALILAMLARAMLRFRKDIKGRFRILALVKPGEATSKMEPWPRQQ